MGYATHRFATTVDDNLLCDICRGVLEAAVLTPCGHSFCQECLDTWLARGPHTLSCPTCRSPCHTGDARPIRSVRGLIGSLPIACPHADRGCPAVVKLDLLQGHVGGCGFGPVDCAGCGLNVNRTELAAHQLACYGIQAEIGLDANRMPSSLSPTVDKSIQTSTPPAIGDSFLSEWACRVATLEVQLSRARKEMDVTEVRSRSLERELNRAREELTEKRRELISHSQRVTFDPDYDYGYAPHTIASLSFLISRFLLKKPTYIDRDRIFAAVKRCYDYHAHGLRAGEFSADVHMLLATAFASNWFKEKQKLTLQVWLQNMARQLPQSRLSRLQT